MWKQILDMAKRLLMLAEDTKRNRDEIKELREEVRRLTSALERLAYEIRHVSERDEGERERLALHLENELLKFERRLPSAKEGRKRGDKG
jgi:predicted  nucleic acid-binding Zn-ribbon protein